MTANKDFLDTPALVLVILAFLASGSVYLLFPTQHYTYGWAVYIKYAILTLGIILGSITASPPQTLTVKHFLLATWAVSLTCAWMMGAETQRVILYGLPAIALLLPGETRAYLPALAFSVLVLALLGAAYEAVVVGGFKSFADMGYRASSIFLNPNNMAIAAVLLVAYAMQMRNRTHIAVALLACVALVVISGSKAGLALFALLMVWFAWRRNAKLAVVVFCVAIGLTFIGLSLDWFRAPYLSLYFRAEQIAAFIRDIGNPIFPFAFRERAAPYVDNVYLQTWNEMGMPAAIVLIVTLIYVGARDNSRSPLWLIFGAAGMSENFIYLWPLAYIFWTYVAAPPRRPPPLRPGQHSSIQSNQPVA